MAPPEVAYLRQLIEDIDTSNPDARRNTWIGGRDESWLTVEPNEVVRKSVLIATKTQLATARVLVEIDGLAGRLTLCPPDISLDWMRQAAVMTSADVVVTDEEGDLDIGLPRIFIRSHPIKRKNDRFPADAISTEWVLPTSGTSGFPKFVAHHLSGLVGAISCASSERREIWSTFYDIRRFGGLQVLLRAIIGARPLALFESVVSLQDRVSEMRRLGVTHVTGTPTHWRRLLMSGLAKEITPDYVRLSGEIADAPLLRALASIYPGAKIVHAYASTEAGVVFEVDDREEGFPVGFVSESSELSIRVVDGSLHVKSPRVASSYVGSPELRLVDEQEFVDTEDAVELRGERYHFLGRKSEIVNVGGLKVHPEEVERIINRHPAVALSLVKGRKNALMGSIVVARVVAKAGNPPSAKLEQEVIDLCRANLERHKQPALIEFVDSLADGASGKLGRRNA